VLRPEFPVILEEVHDRVTSLLRRRGRLPEEPNPTDPVAEQMPLLAGVASASIQELGASFMTHVCTITTRLRPASRRMPCVLRSSSAVVLAC
jgi:hypothetical protein